MRDFLRNFARLATGNASKRYVIMKHSKPIGVFTPWEAQKKELKQGYPGLFWDEMEKLRGPIGNGNLTQKIDEIVYGIGRESVPD